MQALPERSRIRLVMPTRDVGPDGRRALDFDSSVGPSPASPQRFGFHDPIVGLVSWVPLSKSRGGPFQSLNWSNPYHKRHILGKQVISRRRDAQENAQYDANAGDGQQRPGSSCPAAVAHSFLPVNHITFEDMTALLPIHYCPSTFSINNWCLPVSYQPFYR